VKLSGVTISRSYDFLTASAVVLPMQNTVFNFSGLLRLQKELNALGLKKTTASNSERLTELGVNKVS